MQIIDFGGHILILKTGPLIKENLIIKKIGNFNSYTHLKLHDVLSIQICMMF